MFASVTLRLLDHFSSAVFTHAGCVKDSFVILDTTDVAVEEIEVIAISIVFVLQGFVYLAD